MKIKGWVYVISNPAMPGIIKVGYSTKDPSLRAQELNNTGAPHPYSVQYETLVWDPYSLEQRVHKALYSKLEGKEWFRCTVHEAIAAVQSSYTDCFILENYFGAEPNNSPTTPVVGAESVSLVTEPSLGPVVLRVTKTELEAHEQVMKELDKQVRHTANLRTRP